MRIALLSVMFVFQFGSFTVLTVVFYRNRRLWRHIAVLQKNYCLSKACLFEFAHRIPDLESREAALLAALEYKLQWFQTLLDLAYHTRKPQLFVERFKAFAHAVGSDHKAFADLRYVVDKRCHGLVEHLRRAHPDLTDYELDMLCMLRFGFSPDCIRLLHRHENVYSLYSRRNKIHKKLGLPAHVRLETYLARECEHLKKKRERLEQQNGQSDRYGTAANG